MMNRRRFMAASLACALPAAHGQNTSFPLKPVTVICPWPAGGGTDTLLRALVHEAERHLGYTIRVVNTTGGGGAVGHSAITQARPDGYTLGMITFELNSLQVQGQVPFTYRDFDPLMRINSDAAALTVRRDAPFDNLREFIRFARSHPGELTLGSSGAASVWHLAGGLFAAKAGIQVRHVPFDGAMSAVTALLSGHIKAVSVSVPEVRAQVQAGNLRVLAVMDDKRDELFPDVPTFAEQGLPVSFSTWRGLALPLGVPDETKARLTDAFKRAFDSPAFRESARKASLNLDYQDGPEFARFLDRNYADVAAVMRALGLAKR
ncbi:Bug family tripartite tricarboxylate transporter substrate binding protein [Uliginosibacterium sp. H1]|uniref:Bug family tripartite tricarboxylate transporter substrate binding protein n=1 Tax=Uliginosibacterium sp. H1 TaxID=3114757 RepID=UPI002E178AB0|nr:tripartite tricarboxylate transporter substrate binding protein [Uliginosibacterium sp. H1]